MRQRVEQVLVATGGGDHTGVGPRVAEHVKAALPGSGVVLVRGPYAQPVEIPEGVQIANAPASLFNLLVEADLAVSAAGQTMLEALALGTPCVALVTAENQRRQALALQRAGALSVAESVEQAAAAAGVLAADAEARRSRIQVGRREVDGQGAARTAAAVLQLARSPRLE